MASDLKTYVEWRRSALMACVFARKLSGDPSGYGQQMKVLRASSPKKLAASIAAKVSEDVENPLVVASTLIMPAVKDLSMLAQVALALHEHPEWDVSQRRIQDTPGGEVVAFRMTRTVLRVDDKALPSEALVMGPFEEFPRTRRAPVTALEIFVGRPPLVDFEGKDTDKGNLAQIFVPLPTASTFSSMWESTKELRRELLDQVDDLRAKAKVAFVIPVALAETLGCAP